MFRMPSFALTSSLRRSASVVIALGCGTAGFPNEPALPTWSVTANASLAGGYRDNLLLSPSNPEGSSLVRAEVEAMALHVPTGDWGGYAYLNLVEQRFLDARSTEHERTAIVAGELSWQRSPALKAAWVAQAYHQDQVFDVSVTEAELTTTQLHVTGLALGPTLRWNHRALWIEAKALGRRDRYKDKLDGYDEAEGGLTLGWAWDEATEFRLVAGRRRRDHDDRVQFTAAGRPLAGTRLQVRQQEASLQATTRLGADDAWRLDGAVGRQWNRDNGSGYFDFDRELARLGVEWKADAWRVAASAEHAWYEFPVQFVGIGVNPDIRHKRDLRVRAEVARRTGPSIEWFAVVEQERSTSNDERSGFSVLLAYAGVRIEWDNLAALVER